MVIFVVTSQFMRTVHYTTLLLSILLLSSFADNDKSASEYGQLQKFELLALKDKSVGKVYTYDLTKNKGCNKTTIKYLGVIKTKRGKQYKVLSSFFVYSAASTCHGTSNIKIYNLANKFVGQYNVGMPEGLPDALQNNKLVYNENSQDCNLRKERTIDFSNGLRKCFTVACSEKGGDEYCFNNGK